MDACKMTECAIHTPSKMLKDSKLLDSSVVEQKCSNCGRYNVKWYLTEQYEYCPHCGRKVE